MIVLPEYVKNVSELLKDDENCYLVGGAVRDIVLGREIQDFDFSSDADPRRLARKVADRLSGAFYVMDEKRFTSRVIVKQTANVPIMMDFSILQGTLDNDLQQRDFTINAMAIDLHSQEPILDPLKGGRDLQEKWLRPCNLSSFLDDPVRVIRAVRYASELGLKIEPQTSRLIFKAVENLERVSLERKRDELFKILENQRSFSAILLLQKFGILENLNCDPEPDRMGQLRTYEHFQQLLLPVGKRTGADHFFGATFLSAILPIKEKLSAFMAERNSNGHSRFQLDKFVLLPTDAISQEASSLDLLQAFSKEERNFVQQFHNFESVVTTLMAENGEFTNRDAYRFFCQVGDFGVDLVLLGLADMASNPAADLKQDDWLKTLKNSTRLIEVWFENPEISRPKPVVNGNEIMIELALEPGPIVGQLLTALKEEQAAGEISDRKSALAWLKQKHHQINEI